MKKTVKNIITICLTTLFTLMSLMICMGQAWGQKSSHATPSFSSALESASSTELRELSTRELIEDSLFLIDLEFAKVYGDYVYVYDTSDSTIKILDANTNTYKKTHNHYRFYNLKDLIVVNNVIMMLDSVSNSFTCINSDTFAEVTFNQTSLTTLASAKAIEYIEINDKNYLLLCPENPITDHFELAELEVTESSVTISNVSTFSVGENFTELLQGYNTVYTHATADNNLFIMLITNSDIFAFQVNPSSATGVYTTVTGVTGYTLEEDIVAVNDISFYDHSSAIAITTHSAITFYNLAISTQVPQTVTLTQIDEKTIALDNSFNISSAHGNGSTLCAVSNENQSVKIYSFDVDPSTSPNFYNSSEFVNGAISLYLYNPEDFVYLEVVKASSILEMPYSKQGQVVTNVGDNVVIIGEGQDDDGAPISGWYYVMYSTGNQNYYGYIASIDCNYLVESEYSKEYVTVFGFTKLYSLPSKVADSKNIELKTISSSSRLEVLSSTCDYTSFGLKYLLVKVNGEEIGFIDRARVKSSISANEKIIPNATVMRNNSQIFTTTEDDREVIITLDKGARVKVIGKRNEIKDFTKVTFNDSEGNEYTGYIYTYNLESDSWNLLQIIGMFLVVINVILLIIIIVIKNKLTR